ncbi:primosomal protein N' [candidate division KSB1 bacterium]
MLERDKQFAEVALPLPLDRTFTYSVPKEATGRVGVGSLVVVPFGRQTLVGTVVGLADRADYPRIKPITTLLYPESNLDPKIIELCRWAKEYYLVSWGEMLKAAAPPGIAGPQKRLMPTGKSLEEHHYDLRPEAAEALELIQGPRGLTADTLASRLGSVGRMKRAVKNLKDLGLAEYVENPWSRPPPPSQVRIVKLADRESDEIPRLGPRGRLCLDLLRGAADGLSLSRLAEEGVPADSVRRLLARGLLTEERFDTRRDSSEAIEPVGQESDVTLLPAQSAAVETVSASIRQGGHHTFLLFGITGSGKTEIYLRLIRETLDRGRQALVLVPEISLTSQLVARLKAAGLGTIGLAHSGLSAGERFDTWLAARSGKLPLVVGARSAVFTPFDNLGLIVVDEEHDQSFKQSERPAYHARDLAVKRSQIEGIPVVLGSATPSLESYHNASVGKYKLIEMPERAKEASLPEIRVVDLRGRKWPDEGEESLWSLSEELVAAIGERLQRKEQVILFLNRRGFANFIICRECGQVEQCPQCAVSLTYHLAPERLRCHYCGLSQGPSDTCKRCGGLTLRPSGGGTQRLETELKMTFPEARLLRVDVDTTRFRGSHYQILSRFRRREADILLGTQMIAKGLDFPQVSLVGVINADVGLNLPDFRATERTFQLLTQVAGRAGRDAIPGEVIIQTYAPGNTAVQMAIAQDYPAFAAQELELRQELNYPPHSRLIKINTTSTDMEKASAAIKKIVGQIRRNPRARSAITILGPGPAPLTRLRGRYRWHALLKGSFPAGFRTFLAGLLDQARGERSAVEVTADIDPQDML